MNKKRITELENKVVEWCLHRKRAVTPRAIIEALIDMIFKRKCLGALSSHVRLSTAAWFDGLRSAMFFNRHRFRPWLVPFTNKPWFTTTCHNGTSFLRG